MHSGITGRNLCASHGYYLFSYLVVGIFEDTNSDENEHEEEYEDEEAGAKKKPRKSGPQSGQYYRRNIKDVLSEEKLQNVTKEAKVRY